MSWKAIGQPTVRKQREQVGRAHRRHRYSDGQASASTTRHLRVAAAQHWPLPGINVSRPSAAPNVGRLSWLVRRYVAGKSRHHAEGTRAVHVGDPTYRAGSRRDPVGATRSRRMSPIGSTHWPKAARSVSAQRGRSVATRS